MRKTLWLPLVPIFSMKMDVLDLEHTRPDQFSRVQWLDRPERTSRSKNSSVRKRRETEDVVEIGNKGCSMKDFKQNVKDNTFHHTFEGDNNPSIALAWTGDDGDTLLAITTYESYVSHPSKIYRSTDAGKKWNDITDSIDNELIRRKSGVLTSPADSKRVILVVNNHPMGYATTSEIYVTLDKGETWNRREVPFEMNGANLKFHPTNPEAILGTDASNGRLHVTFDFGQTWTAVHESGRAHAFKWDPKHDKIFFYTHDPTGLGRKQNFALTLYRSKDGGKTIDKLAEHVWSFGIEEEFLFVSVRYQPKGKAQSRIMHVSKDHGDHFDAVQLPAVGEDQFFSILDANEGMIFMHIDENGDTGKGTIYTSDSSGIVYTVSLEDNLYPNGEDVTDFIRIKSLKGVYITSKLRKDQSIVSLISYDKGATWDNFTEPLNCEKVNFPDNNECNCNRTTEDYCHLQLHASFSMAKGVDLPEIPYSTENAPGLILAHGNVGDSLSTDTPDLYVSSDGGYNWNRALQGAHRTAIGDSGSIIWAVAHGETVDTLKYSFDEGLCWQEETFVETPITITGLIAEPGERATDIAVWGWDDIKDCWVVYTFNFKNVLNRECETSDYLEFHAHEDYTALKEQNCQLGELRVYQKLKKESVCYNGRAHKSQENAQTCECTKYDYKCDFGYKRSQDEKTCEQDDEQLTMDHICIDGKEEEITSTKDGYVKIPGDMCKGGFEPHREEKKIKRNCPEEEEFKEEFGMAGSDSWHDYIDIADLFNTDGFLERNSESDKLLSESGMSGASKSTVAFLVLLVLSLIGTVGFFFVKSRKKSQSVVQYNTMINDTDGDVEPIDPGTPAATFRDDENDSDDDAMLA